MTPPELQRRDAVSARPESSSGVDCEVCHGEISRQQMAVHPLASVCLECLDDEERAALERDLESAGRVQRALLPPIQTEHDGWEVAYLWEPFGTVSGDHLDLLPSDDVNGPIHLLLGDVSGKGVAASLLQVHLHALLRALAPGETSLASLFARASRLFYQATAAESFATLAGLRLFADGRAVIANAGHPRPLLADRRGVRPVEDASLPIGILDGACFVEREIRLRSGDQLLLYTDGWTEAEVEGEQYGVGRAAATLRRFRHLSPPQLLAACRADLQSFLDGTSRGDDLTMVAIRRR